MSMLRGVSSGASLLAMALLSGCGGGGSDGGGTGVVVVPAPTPAPPPAPSPSPAPAAPTPTPAALPNSWANVAALYDVQPDLAGCRAGVLKAGVRAQALADVNRIRALHGLSPVLYGDGDDAQVQEASLMMAANNQLSHTPPTSWTCYSATGSTGAGSSNLYIAWGGGLGFMSADDHLAAWINEGGTAALGHRRWILSPFLGRVTYGRFAVQKADGGRVDAATLKVFGFAAGRASATRVPGFVAVPQGDYPVRYFRPNDYLSFSVAPSATADGSDRRVNLQAARIRVTGPDGTALPISNQSADNDGYGLANNLQWRVAGLVRGITYDVRIDGVTGAPASQFTYSFRIVD